MGDSDTWLINRNKKEFGWGKTKMKSVIPRKRFRYTSTFKTSTIASLSHTEKTSTLKLQSYLEMCSNHSLAQYLLMEDITKWQKYFNICLLPYSLWMCVIFSRWEKHLLKSSYFLQIKWISLQSMRFSKLQLIFEFSLRCHCMSKRI